MQKHKLSCDLAGDVYISVLSIDMSDVKVYVELASISAGENDTEIDQVACFHDAVMGYAPLLFYLNPQAGFDEFLKCAQLVWDTQSRDEKLPDKLVFISPLLVVAHKFFLLWRRDSVGFSERIYSIAELVKRLEGDPRLCGAVLSVPGFFC